MKQLLLILSLILISDQIAAQGTGKAYINGNAISVIDLSEDVYELEFMITEESIKDAWMAKAKNFQYGVEIKFLQDGGCDLEEIHQWQDAVNGTSLTSFPKENKAFKTEIDGMKFLMSNAIKDCTSLPPDLQVAFNFMVLNKSGELSLASQIIVQMPGNAKSASLAEASSQALALFSNGMAADSYNNQPLKKAVESYMEAKWPDEDITTVHLTSQKFTNTAQTSFDLEGYYITKASNGNCNYNSFYGKGTGSGSRYSISFFNSMDAEKEIDCSVSEKFKNL
ncbi:MAG: hypothetical protein RIC35_04655 [Marinoscillum sp.]